MNRAQLIETEDALAVIDGYGDRWVAGAGDGNGNYMVEREETDRWVAGQFNGTEIYECEDGKTFGVSCQDEFIVRVGQWVENATTRGE